MQKTADFLVIGGGAAGFFAAINYALQRKNARLPQHQVVIVEKTGQLLKKVKISGGGRCNLTHACFDPHDLVTFYPRGYKELLSPFLTFGPTHTIAWFKEQGVLVKTEADGRVFPVSNSSQTIIDCFLSLAKTLNIDIVLQQPVVSFAPAPNDDTRWQVITTRSEFITTKLVVATGGSSPLILRQLENLELSITPPIPSLFTFNTKDQRLASLSGVAVDNASVQLLDDAHRSKRAILESGAVLITHWGLSGPAILKMSAVAATLLHQQNYRFTVKIDWCRHIGQEAIHQQCHLMRIRSPNKVVMRSNLCDLPKRLWASLVAYTNIAEDVTWAHVTKKQLNALVSELKNSVFVIQGKSTNKEEFVSCGGLNLKEINFSDFSVKQYTHLYVVGELLNIDALTGGFNFQAAWTGGYLAALADMA